MENSNLHIDKSEKNTSDLSYIINGLFVTFVPNTEDGESVYREMHEQSGSTSFQFNHLDAILRQIRKAGYTVSKAKKSKLTIDDILNSDLAKELGI